LTTSGRTSRFISFPAESSDIKLTYSESEKNYALLKGAN